MLSLFVIVHKVNSLKFYAFWLVTLCLWSCTAKKPRHYILRPFFPKPDATRIHANKVTLAVVNQLVQHNPETSYSVNMDESFQQLPQIIQARLRRLCCQDQIHDDYKCLLYLEALLVEMNLSAEAEAIVTASLVFRSILLELQSALLIGYDKQPGVAYLTVKAVPYIGEIRTALTEILGKKDHYLLGTLCFHRQTCNT